MEILETKINGILVIHPKVFLDDRGFFFESYNYQKFKDNNLPTQFVQDNFSKSFKNTIRGLHYQIDRSAQGKLCQVLLGKVLDVVVDIRYGSPTYGKYFSIELSQENHYQVWVPPGFAHGFAVLSDEALFHYKCTGMYNKEDERCILFNDVDLKINWGIDKPVVSEKDLNGKKFKDIDHDFIFKS
jgi:dTDP-4-dehydrorhamnose 3,5-epimerase